MIARTPDHLRDILAFTIEVATEAGEMLLDGFARHHALDLERKEDGVNNIVTEMDIKSEKIIRERVEGKFGGRFIGEESAEEIDLNGRVWIVDPIDGTVNYAKGIPLWTVSIALVEDGVPLAGVVYEPVRGSMYSAYRGGGAWCNGEPIHCSGTRNIQEGALVTGFPYNIAENPFGAIDTFSRVLYRGIAVRRLGSAALDMAWVAAGIFDGFWEVALKPWDVAAGVLLVREAGGIVGSYGSTVSNDDLLITDRVVGTNGLIHEELMEILVDPDQ